MTACPVALCLGGLDPSAGAGLLRDALTLASLGVHPLTLPTAETLQNGVACASITAPGMSARLRLEFLKPHLGGPWGVKLGLTALELPDLEGLLADLWESRPTVAIWDPIQAPTVGPELHTARGLARLADRVLASGTWVVTPNRLEAAALAELDLEAPPEALAEPWLARGARAVWLKGGHGRQDWVEDLWITPTGTTPLGRHSRLPGERRGTGCTLAAAWLAYRLQGRDDGTAATEAARWLRAHWENAAPLGGVGRPTFLPAQAPA